MIKKIVLAILIVAAVLAALAVCAALAGGWRLFVIRLTLHSSLPHWFKAFLWGWL